MKLLGIINDTEIKRGIIVSKNGYTPDAQKYAKHHNILIVQLREAGREYPDNIENFVCLICVSILE